LEEPQTASLETPPCKEVLDEHKRWMIASGAMQGFSQKMRICGPKATSNRDLA
jgi:hypothetical protein